MRSSIGTIGENTTLDDWLLYNIYNIFMDGDDTENNEDTQEERKENCDGVPVS